MSELPHAFAAGQRLVVKVSACVCPIRVDVLKVFGAQVLLQAAPIGLLWFSVDEVEVHEVLEAGAEPEQPGDPYVAAARKSGQMP